MPLEKFLHNYNISDIQGDSVFIMIISAIHRTCKMLSVFLNNKSFVSKINDPKILILI